jgi:hypothetical protein
VSSATPESHGSRAATHGSASVRRAPAEVTEVHTRILRNMLATDDSYAYWQRIDPSTPLADRAHTAFERRWFGTKSEARVRTLMTDMAERFDAFPEALAALHSLGAISASLRPFICHLHTQLADPLYRRFTGDHLPELRAHGRDDVDRNGVARWVDGLEPRRWSSTTTVKFGSNLLATAFEVGLVAGRRDPRKLAPLQIPDVIVGYALYLLRGVSIAEPLLDNAYLRSLGVTREGFRTFAPRVPGIRFAELGGASELTFEHASLREWAPLYLGAAA